MSNVMTVALQFTAVDMLSGIASRVRNSIMSLGSASKEVKRDFDDMSRHVTTGLKAIAASYYTLNKIKPGIAAAGDLQESMIDVRMNLMESGKDAAALNKELADVRRTAVDVSKVAPFGAKEVIDIENVFLKAGLKIQDVVGKRGAAYAATALATLSKELPETIAESMVMMATPFNVKGSQFGELADFIQRVDAASATTIPELMEGMKYLSGTAAAMKLSWQDTLKLQGLVAQSGLRGSMGGTSLNAFLTRLTGGTRAVKHMLPKINAMLAGRGAKPLEFFDKQGKMKTIPAIIDNMRQALKRLTEQEKLVVMQRVFGDEGARAALALIKEGDASWESFGKNVEAAANITDKMNERLKGVNANIKALRGTAQTTLASLFDPLLTPLAKVISMLNNIVGKIGQIADSSPALSGVFSGGLTAGALGIGAYGIYKLLKGGVAGSRVLKGMGGLKGMLAGMGGTAAGIAQGKAVEAATGVTPVFVTNWPAGGLGVTPAVGVPGGGKIPIGTMAKWAGLGGLALAAGYGAGTGINMVAGGVSGLITGGKHKGSGWLGDMFYDFLHKAESPEVNNQINITIDKDGRATTTTNNSRNTDTKVNLNRGSFFSFAH